MKAIVCPKYGPPEVLQYQDVETPTPKANEVRIKIHTATVTAGDCELRGFYIAKWIRIPMGIYMGFRKPKTPILGMELAGEVDAIGKDVNNFKVGDRIFGTPGMNFGAYAQYTCFGSNECITTIPDEVSYEDAVTIPVGGANGLHFVRKSNIQAGEKVLLNGAGGSIGTYAIQLAKSLGAEITAVDSAEKLDMLKTIGADHVIDYRTEDFTQNGVQYDVIIDIVGKSDYSNSLKSLKKNGRYILGNPTLNGMFRSMFTNRMSDKKVIWALADNLVENLDYLKSLLAKGELKAVIDKRYPLEEVPTAHHYVEEGHKAGHLVINIEHQDS